jgi:predicted tellurium resistance membrane protein TerC
LNLLDPELIVAFLTLAALEIVLGIDNIIFLSIMAAKLPVEQQARARTIGLAGAMVMRIGLLLSLSWIARLTTDLFTVFGMGFSGRDLILSLGGLFLFWKAGGEIRLMLAGDSHQVGDTRGDRGVTFAGIIVQIMVLDIVFSLDSVITAVGMTDNIPVMIAAIVAAVITMMFFSGPLSRFVDRNPTVKMLALAFLLLIGGILVLEGVDVHVSKAYVYTAMAFSVMVEFLNLRMRRKMAELSAQALH